jgi:Ca2+/Na+ antiporter
MDFSIIIESIVTFLRDNPLIVIALTFLLIIMLFRKPKLFFIISFITLILAAALYVISVVSFTGVTEKKELIDKSVKDLPKE